jgi:hypothetical protein
LLLASSNHIIFIILQKIITLIAEWCTKFQPSHCGHFGKGYEPILECNNEILTYVACVVPPFNWRLVQLLPFKLADTGFDQQSEPKAAFEGGKWGDRPRPKVVHKQETILRIMKKLNSCAKSQKLI